MHRSIIITGALSALSVTQTRATTSTDASTSTAPSPTGINRITNGHKGGLSGYIGVQDIEAFNDLAPYISWYSDYTANTPTTLGVTGVGMLWGAQGSACTDVYPARLATFEKIVGNNKTVPDIMFGFYEPDCECWMSSQMSVESAAADWNSLIAPLSKEGTVLGSPSMCTQYDENFLSPFNDSISGYWDVTSIHINKPNLSEAQKDVEYYWKKYQKPVWVSEFACVYDQPSWEPCTEQGEIDQFINDLVDYFQNETNVVAYGASNGAGLGDVWPLTYSPGNGTLTPSGQTYLNALKR